MKIKLKTRINRAINKGFKIIYKYYQKNILYVLFKVKSIDLKTLCFY